MKKGGRPPMMEEEKLTLGNLIRKMGLETIYMPVGGLEKSFHAEVPLAFKKK